MFSHAFSMISPTKNGSIGHGLQVYVGPDEGYVQEQGDRAMNSASPKMEPTWEPNNGSFMQFSLFPSHSKHSNASF
jgi:hypothetical protein